MTKRYALIIGNSHYDDDALPNLTTPASDADDLAAVLRQTDVGGFDDVQVLHNATLTEMRVAVGELFGRQHKPDDMLLFYFSGHGELDNDDNLYLVGRDTRRGSLLRVSRPTR